MNEAIEKAKEALRRISDMGTVKTIPCRSLAGDKHFPSRIVKNEYAKIADEALAALESEKPAEDIGGLAGELLAIFANGGNVGYVLSKIDEKLKSYATSYHAQKCKECKGGKS